MKHVIRAIALVLLMVSLGAAAQPSRCRTDVPLIVNPPDGATITTPEVRFQWTAVTGAVGYRVYVRQEDTRFVLAGSTAATFVVRPAVPGTFRWYVEAVFAQCPSTRSAESGFGIPRSQTCSNERPQPVSPANGAADLPTPVEFRWTSVAGAAGYAIIAQTDEGASTVVGGTRGETTLTAHMPFSRRINWRVVAFRSGCDPIVSVDFTFTTAPPPAACVTAQRPILVTPPEGARAATPVHFAWTPVEGATGYRVFAGLDGELAIPIATTTTPSLDAPIPAGSYEWFVEASFAGCPPLRSGSRRFESVPPPTACTTPEEPQISVVGQTLSDTPFAVRWTPLPGAAAYELQQSETADFASPQTFVVDKASGRPFFFPNSPTRPMYFRVRGVAACNFARGPFSDTATVLIVSTLAAEHRGPRTAEVGLQRSVMQRIRIPGSSTPTPFTITTDQPWLEVQPSSGTLTAEGVVVTLTADARPLDVGANKATLRMSLGGASGSRSATEGSTTVNIPVSVSLVTPVAPTGKNTPPDEALIIPAVGHAPGANNSLFQSDVRIANTSTQPMTYLVTFTPSGVEGTLTSTSTTIEVTPGATVALDDVLASFFGSGPDGIAIGVLEVRPLTTSTVATALATSVATATIASSRTYNVTDIGTLGQYIPAIPFSQFIARATASRNVLSLQQVAESALYRTNLGLVEASGEPAEMLIRVFNSAGDLLGEMPESLRASEHKQINSILSVLGIASDDARIEVEVTSATGRVTAYASRVDNLTNDPLLVQPVDLSTIGSTRYVIPGVAYADGAAKWRSDVRIFNAATSATPATITFFPQNNPAGSMAKDVELAAGEVLALDNVLHEFFGVSEPNAGGSLLIVTPAASTLVATARTYSETDNGTYGLFAPGVTPEESVALGGRSLQLLQLEHSDAFRTNIGLVETTGQPATVEVSLIQPGALTTGKLEIPLAANAFVQFPMSAWNTGASIYNGRVAVRVISGAGSVSAYGSVIDNKTNDSTYVPAQ